MTPPEKAAGGSTGRTRRITESPSNLNLLEPAAARWISALIRMTSAHPAMTRILDVMERLQDRPFRTNVVLLGEPGTGKEGLARALHQLMSPRGPLVRFDVTGFSEDDAMAALCGRGRSRGAAEEADGGTLLIEEAAEMPLRVQGEMLRLLKAGKVRKLESSQDPRRRLNVNAIALSDRDLEAEVRAGRFRHDLYYRLARIVLWLPPLRERLEDVGPAAVWMGNRILAATGVPLVLRGVADMARASEEEKRRSIELTDDAVETLKSQPWDGNLRELEAAMERALLLYRTGPKLGREEMEAALEPYRPID